VFIYDRFFAGRLGAATILKPNLALVHFLYEFWSSQYFNIRKPSRKERESRLDANVFF